MSDKKETNGILFNGHIKKVLKGNSAVAEAVKLCRVGFVPAYPITPQTTIVEEISSMIANGDFNASFTNMESEHSVFAAAKGAALAGERVFTATSGQGLFYAHEVLHAIAHMRLPVVACNVGRPSFPWNIWCDQTDSVSQRDTGWIQLYGESSQEVLDTVIQAYRIAECLSIPVLVMLDAFYQSHTTENVYVPEQELVDNFLPGKIKSDFCIDIKHPRSFGGLVAPDTYMKFNYQYWQDISKAEEVICETGKLFNKLFGRDYGVVEAVNVGQQTKMILVTMSSLTTTVRGILAGHPEIGLLKIRLFKPFPLKSVLRVTERMRKDCIIVNIDRNFPGDLEGALMQEMKRALYGKNFTMLNAFAGLGGKDVPPSSIERIIEKGFACKEEVYWIDSE